MSSNDAPCYICGGNCIIEYKSDDRNLFYDKPDKRPRQIVYAPLMDGIVIQGKEFVLSCRNLHLALFEAIREGEYCYYEHELGTHVDRLT